jgi:hypothetical protein
VLRSKIGLKVFVKLSPPSPSVVEYKRGSDAVLYLSHPGYLFIIF